MTDDNRRLYPKIPSAPTDESHIYRLSKISEIETFFRKEIEERNNLAKKVKIYVKALKISDILFITIDTGVCSALSLTGIGIIPSIAIATLVPVAQVPFGIALAKLQARVKKHQQVKLLAESKLDSVNDKISKAINNVFISDIEFSDILNEKTRYLQKKEEIRTKTKQDINKITAEARQKLIEQGRQKEREEIAKNLTKPKSA